MHLLIQTNNRDIDQLYTDHSTYHEGDSGLDLFFIEDLNIGPYETKLISLGIKCEAFTDKDKSHNISYYLYPRSSISKTPLRMSNSVGIIDAGYRGDIMVSLDNISDKIYEIKKGQRLFQLCSPILAPISFELTDNLSETSRGEGGFGSTNAQ
jgi:dUTP pyrophosphatase